MKNEQRLLELTITKILNFSIMNYKPTMNGFKSQRSTYASTFAQYPKNKNNNFKADKNGTKI